MSRPALARMLSLGNALAAQERAAAADAAYARELAEDARELALSVTARAAAARGHGGEVSTFLAAQTRGAAAAHAAVDATTAAGEADAAARAAVDVLRERRIQLKAVERLAHMRAETVRAADLASAQAIVDDAVAARSARRATTGEVTA